MNEIQCEDSRPAIIKKISQTSGFYLLRNEEQQAAVPVYVDELGQIWTMQLDQSLRPDGWLDVMDFDVCGPLNFASPALGA